MVKGFRAEVARCRVQGSVLCVILRALNVGWKGSDVAEPVVDGHH